MSIYSISIPELLFQVIKDYHLFGIVIFLLMVDCVVLISWSLVHSLKMEVVVENKKVCPQ